MPKAKAQKKSKRGIFSRWKRQIVVNSMQARLRAQLGDRSKYSGERRRRSVVVASIVLTITDPLRGLYHFWNYLQAALIRSCGASFACMELTIISRFQRLKPPQNLYFIHYFIVFQCFRSIASLPCKIIWEIWYDLFSRNHFIIRGFSPWNGERFLSLGQSGQPS